MEKLRKIASVTDRIILHLLDFKSYEGEIDGSIELTQIGIGDAVGIARGNVAKAIQPLIDSGYVDSHKVHVPGIRLKRTIYYLTCQGHEKASHLKEKLGKLSIDVIDRDGARSSTCIADLLNNSNMEMRFIDVVREANASRQFDFKAFQKKRAQPILCTSSGIAGIPHPSHFFGRSAEEELVSNWMYGRPGCTVVINGMPGIGKTSFISHVLSKYRNPQAVHFFSIRPWCSMRALLMPLSAFFEENGRRELKAYLEENRALDMSEVQYLITGILTGIENPLLAYDDYHNSSEEVRTFIKMLHDSLRETGFRLMVVGRTVNPFYDRKDAAVRKAVLELTLEGLDPDSTQEMARKVGVPEKYIGEIFAHTRGHPLFVELLATGGTPDMNMDVEKFINDEFMAALGDQELEVLKCMSVYRYAVGRGAMAAYQKVLTGLIRESVVRQTGADNLELHDMIKSSVYKSLSQAELERYHARAAEHYLESNTTDCLMEGLHHLIKAGRHRDAYRVILDREAKLLNSDRMGELAQALGIILSKNLDMDKEEKARLLYIQGRGLSFLGEWDEAVMCFNRAAVIASKNELLVMKNKSGIAEILLMRNNYSVAQSIFEEILAWAECHDALDLASEANYQLGSVHERLGNYYLALDFFDKSSNISFVTHNRNQLAKAYYGKGRLLQRKDEYEKSLECKNMALEIAMKIGDSNTAAKILTGIGATYDSLGMREKEIESHEAAILLARKNGAVRVLGYALSNAGAAYLDKAELEKSIIYLNEASIIFENLGEQHMFATAEMNKAIHALLIGKNEEAFNLFNTRV